jgi:hypothetical protein
MHLYRRADGLDKHGDAPYSLDYANRSARVVIVASEPITSTASEWVAVPKNHALVVTRDSDGWMNVLHTPMAMGPPGARVESVIQCVRSIPLTPVGTGHRAGSPVPTWKNIG